MEQLTVWHAIILGVVQGVTEFLPISSSGHLVLVQKIFGFDSPLLILDALVHLGSLGAIGYFFRDKIRDLSGQYGISIVIGSLPAIVVGLLIRGNVESLFDSLIIVAFGWLITATLLYLTQRKIDKDYKTNSLSIRRVLLIGIFQAMAFVPGISRSGSTIAAGIFVGLKRDEAFSLSFIIAIPIIALASMAQIWTEIGSGINSHPWELYAIGVLTAFVSGLLSLGLLSYVVKHAKFGIFAIYCTVMALLVLWWSLGGNIG